MATIKGYTDIEQSKKLAEILPLESADMYYMEASYNNYTVGVLQRMERDMLFKQAEYYKMSPCWSLTVLLSILPEIDGISLKLEKVKAEDGYDGYYYHIEYEGKILIPYCKNPVDACYKMIIHLNNLNLL